MYKRTKVEEFAEYVQYDGLVTKISRFDDMECEGDTSTIEEIYKNRQDCLDKILRDCETQKVTEYFRSGREDGMKGMYKCGFLLILPCSQRFVVMKI